MRKTILALSICALIPAVTVAVAYADDDEEIEFVEDEEYEDSETYADDAEDTGVAEEERVIAKRVTCDDIKKEMDELDAKSELDDVEKTKLASLKTDYRSKCVKSAGTGRRAVGRGKAKSTVSARARIPVAEPEVVEQAEDIKKPDVASVVNTGCDNPDKNGCCPGETYKDLGEQGFNCCTENDEHCFPPMKKSSPTCDDGSTPDKDGCCAGETYKDLGELGFNCCLSDGVTCFPPIK